MEDDKYLLDDMFDDIDLAFLGKRLRFEHSEDLSCDMCGGVIDQDGSIEDLLCFSCIYLMIK